ncbi:Rtf1 RNA polymerase II-associated Paf1 complex subunit [Candida orthopsilosis Co 90-125]|uniref:Rtf1 RNA polymerase II-associated Paf1 complex subunit n=1 Tax=Candida orthopsilosis (strain 90-125) TaxID=1136231 RepID=H8XAS6_CANO9|nr:Rtf1 RNA polymerase II-associated Paf1 complex subunit [Candida orthopsilosis Co 90-125]CCG24927.1 Rtf1 RNA polymerase II-associated Paf1 complex subunit [Candida orthopsilosis Co 90-125]
MSDLEDDLLALAGGEDYESDVGSTTSKRSNLEYESDDDDTVLAKRRKLESDAGDYVAEGEEELELVNPYPLEGKYKDEQDREELEAMDEIKREEILFERSQEMDKFKERQYLQQRMKAQREPKQGRTENLRSSTRSKTGGAKSKKESKLSELKKEREKHTRKKTRKSDDYEEESDEDEEDEEGEDEDEGLLEDDEDAYNDESETEVMWGGVSKTKRKRSTELAKLEDINRIKVGRSLLSQYCYHPGFDDTVLDTYTKVNLGVDKVTRTPMYRMVKIIDMKTRPEKSYRIGSSKYDLYFLVSQNKNQKKPFAMNLFSDSPITQEEFDRYLNELDKTGETIDLLDDVNDKYNQLQTLFNKGLTDEDINEMITRKQRMSRQSGNYTSYDAVKTKARLMDELKIYKQQGNLQKTKEIIEELKDINNVLQDQNFNTSSTSSSSQSNIAKVNERNRKLNQENIRKAEIKFKSDIQNQSNQDGDPFSRLKTVTRMFYQDLINEENAKALKDVNMQELIDERTKQEAKIAKSSYRDLGEVDKLIKSIDIDIELLI